MNHRVQPFPIKCAGIKIKFRLLSVMWTDWPERDWCCFHGFGLRKHDRAAKIKIAKMLRAMPKKWDRRKGQTAHIFNLPEVTESWW